MKKPTAAFAIALIGALCTSTTTNAQDGKSVRFGVQLAPHMAWLTSDAKSLSNDGSKFGFKFGLMGDFMIGANQNYAFSTGLYYVVSTGYKAVNTVTESGFTTVSKTDVKLSYVQLPITLKLLTNEIGYMKYYVQLGGDLGLRTAAKYDGTSVTPLGTVSVDNEDATDIVNSFRAGLIVGGGMEYNFSGNTSAMLGITYNNGLTDLFTSKDVAAGAKGKLNYFELNLGVFF